MTEPELVDKANKYIGAARQSCPGTTINNTNVVLLASALMLSDAMLEIAETLKLAVDTPEDTKGDGLAFKPL